LLNTAGEFVLEVRRTVPLVATEEGAMLQVTKIELEVPGLSVIGFCAGHDNPGSVPVITNVNVDCAAFWLVLEIV
jgi:hypothetical protein